MTRTLSGRLSAFGLSSALILGPAAPVLAQALPAPSSGQMVDALHTAFGDHHSRAVHAKGVMVEGVFEPAKAAAGLSDAPIFRTKSVPVLARFSDFTGIPDIPDNIGDANPRGFALKFKLADGTTMDVVTHSFNGFPTATAGEFRELLLAIPVSGPTAAKPTALDKFLATHPIAATFLTTQKPPPVSYATRSYFGVNAFSMAGPGGRRAIVRYRFVPVAGEASLSKAALAAAGPNYLSEELPKRLASGPVTFKWYAQVAEPSDNAADPSVAWPESRKLIELGTIRITRMAPDQTVEQTTMFAPLNIPKGIAPADPMLTVRDGAYSISFQHRQSSQFATKAVP